MTTQIEQQVGLRTHTLKFIMKCGLSVREFKANAKRTRLKSTKDLDKVKKHVNLWKNYGWLQ
jgi:hypothetical protein